MWEACVFPFHLIRKKPPPFGYAAAKKFSENSKNLKILIDNHAIVYYTHIII